MTSSTQVLTRPIRKRGQKKRSSKLFLPVQLLALVGVSIHLVCAN